MNDATSTRFARQVGMFALAALLICLSAGFAYVAHLTATTSERLGVTGPSVLPLIALSILSAIAGLAMLRFWLRGDSESA